MSLNKQFNKIQPADHFWVEIYHLMNSIVQPRPIAWISSISSGGNVNLAPFSYFNICSMNPPIISNSIFFNRDGSEKDTLKNIRATKEYVVGAVNFEASEKANQSSAPFDSNINEFEESGATAVNRGPNEPPFIAESPVQLVCELFKIVTLGEGAGVGNLVLGQVKEIHLSHSLSDIDWKKGIPPEKMDNVGRMGADYYTRTRDVYRMPRASVKK